MRVYAESSALLRWLLGEPDGPGVESILRAAEQVVTSRLTLIETTRNLSLAVDRRQIAEAAALESRGILAAATCGWTIAELLPEIAERASQRFPVEPLRTLDAIHLATALFFAREAGPIAVLSTDDRILRNVPALGLHAAA